MATVERPLRSHQIRSAICCAIVPDGMNTAVCLPNIAATSFSKDCR